MSSSPGSSSRSKKKKGSSSKQNKPHSKDAESPFYTCHIIGGNPLEPGTLNYKKLKERYQEQYDLCRKQPTDFFICENDPFSPENLREAPCCNPNDSDTSFFSEKFCKAALRYALNPDEKPALDPHLNPFNVPHLNPFNVRASPDYIADRCFMKSRCISHLLLGNAPDPMPSESKVAGPPKSGPGLEKSGLALPLPIKSALVQTADP